MTILLNLQNLNLSFGEKIIFKDAKLNINQGDHIGLIGLNGNGKSTLFNIITEKVMPDVSAPPFICDRNKEKFTVFYIPQELNTADFTDLTISDFYLSFYPDLLRAHHELEAIQEKLAIDYENDSLLDKQQTLMDRFEQLGGWNIQNAYLSYLNYFELENLNHEVTKLSGGELRKVALSIGLSSKSNLILWDEPTNHLDVETIEKFEDELQNSNSTFIIISHDRYLLNHITNKIIHIEHGEITSYTGTYLQYLEYLEERDKELRKNLDKLENKQRRELAWMRQGVKARGTRSKKRVEGFHDNKDQIHKLKSLAKKTAELSLVHTGRKSKQLVELTDMTFSYDEKTIFKNLDITVFKKDKIALIGPNGAGKSTLIKILAGTIPITSGRRKALDELKVITFDQKRDSLDLERTPFDIVGDGQDFVHLPNGESKHIISYLEGFLFNKDQIHRPSYTLSGGEKNRLQLAMFMTQSADLWIFDEPTNDLDIETIELLERELSSYDAAVIIIGHDRAFLDNTCQKTWLVNNNTIEEFVGGYTQVAPYLHALELEKEQAKKQAKNAAKKTSTPKVEKKEIELSYKDKIRWDVIEAEIVQTEKEIEDMNSTIATLDFTIADDNHKYKSMSEKLAKTEKMLENLYAEWDILSAKVSG